MGNIWVLEEIFRREGAVECGVSSKKQAEWNPFPAPPSGLPSFISPPHCFAAVEAEVCRAAVGGGGVVW